MFVYSLISCEEMRVLPHLLGLREHLQVAAQAGRHADGQPIVRTPCPLATLVAMRLTSIATRRGRELGRNRQPAARDEEPAAENVRVHEVREGLGAVDLDDRDPLAVAPLELRVVR